MSELLNFIKRMAGSQVPTRYPDPIDSIPVNTDRQGMTAAPGSYATSDEPIPIWGDDGPYRDDVPEVPEHLREVPEAQVTRGRIDRDSVADLNRQEMEPTAADAVDEYMKSKGLDVKTRAMLYGNMMVETGGSFDHEQIQEFSVEGRPSVGLFQFEPDGKGLMAPYQQYLDDTNRQDSAQAQIDFMTDVLNESYEPGVRYIGRGNVRAVNRAIQEGTAEDAAREFSERILRPGIPHMEQRTGAARAYYQDNIDRPSEEEDVNLEQLGVSISPEGNERSRRRGPRHPVEETEFEQMKAYGAAVASWYADLKPIDKAAVVTAPIPLVGDVVGTAADVTAFAEDPSLGNFGWLAAGIVLPFVGGQTVKNAIVKPKNGPAEVVNIDEARKRYEGQSLEEMKDELEEVRPLADVIDIERFKDRRPIGAVTYHGTNADFKLYKVDDVDKIDDGWWGPGVYSSGGRDFVNEFVEEYRDGPGLNEAGRKFLEEYKQELIEGGAAPSQVRGMTYQMEGRLLEDFRHNAGPNVRPNKVYMKRPFVVKYDQDVVSPEEAAVAMLDNLRDEIGSPAVKEIVDDLGKPVREITAKDLTPYLKEEGFDGVLVSNPRMREVVMADREELSRRIMEDHDASWAVEVLVYDENQIDTVFRDAEIIPWPDQ